MDLMKLVLLVKVQLTHPTTYYHLLLRILQIRTKVSLQLLMNLQEVLIKSRLGWRLRRFARWHRGHSLYKRN